MKDEKIQVKTIQSENDVDRLEIGGLRSGSGSGSGIGNGEGSGSGGSGEVTIEEICKDKAVHFECSLDNTDGHCQWSGIAAILCTIEKINQSDNTFYCRIKTFSVSFSLEGKPKDVPVEGQTTPIRVVAPDVVLQNPELRIAYNSASASGEKSGIFTDASNGSTKRFRVTFSASASIDMAGNNCSDVSHIGNAVAIEISN